VRIARSAYPVLTHLPPAFANSADSAWDVHYGKEQLNTATIELLRCVAYPVVCLLSVCMPDYARQSSSLIFDHYPL
jgi:hypothetical protein